MGFGVARPWGDERYDFVVDSGHRFSRVQVKSTRKRRTPQSYGVLVSSNRLAPYEETEIDFLVAYLVPEDAWYVIPVNKIQGLETLYFYPHGRRSKWGEVSRGLVPDGVSSRREQPQQDRDAALLRQRPNPACRSAR
jgi:PD-(D/E)XK endonuclease